jgi:hypothetical protein
MSFLQAQQIWPDALMRVVDDRSPPMSDHFLDTAARLFPQMSTVAYTVPQ